MYTNKYMTDITKVNGNNEIYINLSTYESVLKAQLSKIHNFTNALLQGITPQEKYYHLSELASYEANFGLIQAEHTKLISQLPSLKDSLEKLPDPPKTQDGGKKRHSKKKKNGSKKSKKTSKKRASKN